MFRRPVGVLQCLEGQLEVFNVYNTCTKFSMFSSSVKGFLCSEDLYRVFYVQRTEEGFLCLEVLWKVFHVQRICRRYFLKVSRRSSMFRRPLEALLFSEEQYSIFYIYRTCNRLYVPKTCRRSSTFIGPIVGLICLGALWKVFHVQKTCKWSSKLRKPIEGPLSLRDLLKAFCVWKNFRKASR